MSAISQPADGRRPSCFLFFRSLSVQPTCLHNRCTPISFRIPPPQSRSAPNDPATLKVSNGNLVPIAARLARRQGADACRGSPPQRRVALHRLPEPPLHLRPLDVLEERVDVVLGRRAVIDRICVLV